MTQNVSTGYEYPATDEVSEEPPATQQVAKEQATGVASTAGDAGQHVAGVAREQAGEVAAEAGRQVKEIFGQATGEISRQAGEQQQRVADGFRSLSAELGSMAERSDGSGAATDLARQASSTAQDIADWLEQRDPGALLDEVKTFARRRPGTFLAIALGAGLAAGRLTRGLKDEGAPSRPTTGAASASTVSSVPSVPVVPSEPVVPSVSSVSSVPSDRDGEVR